MNLWIALGIAMILFGMAFKSGWDQDVIVPLVIFVNGSAIALGFLMGLGAKYLKLLW